MILFRISLAVFMAMSASIAHAQTLPKPKEFYFDQDAAAKPVVVAKGEGDALTQALLKARERGRKGTEATAQLAHIAMSQNRPEVGKALYEQALQGTQASGSIGRSVRWNYAWDLYRNDEPEAALRMWTELANGFGSPSWVPPTLALALWRVGRKPEAVQWYAAAVRTEPTLWNQTGNFPRLLPGWSDQERARLAEVHAAWTANPPAWP